MIEILGESVKSALGAELMKQFPGSNLYREASTNPYYPHFFLSQLTLSSQEDRRGYYFLRYLMTVRYRVHAEPSTRPNLQAQLDEVGLQMLSIHDISIGGAIIKLTGARYEKVDGVLHYFCNVTLQVKHEDVETVKQQTLAINTRLKEE